MFILRFKHTDGEFHQMAATCSPSLLSGKYAVPPHLLMFLVLHPSDPSTCRPHPRQIRFEQVLVQRHSSRAVFPLTPPPQTTRKPLKWREDGRTPTRRKLQTPSDLRLLCDNSADDVDARPILAQPRALLPADRSECHVLFFQKRPSLGAV